MGRGLAQVVQKCADSAERLVSSVQVPDAVRTHLAQFAKDESTPITSSRFHQLCRFILESEELDERPHALFLTAVRKSPGSCQLGDAMEARPKQFRYNIWLRALPLN